MTAYLVSGKALRLSQLEHQFSYCSGPWCLYLDDFLFALHARPLITVSCITSCSLCVIFLFFSVSPWQFLFFFFFFLPSLSKLTLILFALVSFTSCSSSEFSFFPHLFVPFFFFSFCFGCPSVLHTLCVICSWLPLPCLHTDSHLHLLRYILKTWPLTAVFIKTSHPTITKPSACGRAVSSGCSGTTSESQGGGEQSTLCPHQGTAAALLPASPPMSAGAGRAR